MHRFFLPGATLAPGAEADLAPLHRQLRRVLRARAGDRIVLLDGCGFEHLTELQVVDDRRAAGRVLEKRPATGEPHAHVTLFQCALKGDKMEWVLQKGTELGVSRFVPVISNRTVVRPASVLLGKYERWQAIVREAAEQSGRGLLPELAAPVSYGEAVAQAEGACFLPWEQAAGAPGLADELARRREDLPGRCRFSLLVGPEGGLSAAEAEAGVQAGWELVTLGPRILRAETAALAALAAAMSALGEMGPRAGQDVGPPTAAAV